MNKKMKTPSELYEEIPKCGEMVNFLRNFFKTNFSPLYIDDLIEIIGKAFDVSSEAMALETKDMGWGSHATGTANTCMDSIVYFAVRYLYDHKEIKRVQPNTYESLLGPDPEMVDSPGLRAARTRAGLSDIMVSIRILMPLSKYANKWDEMILDLADSPAAKSHNWSLDMIMSASDHVKEIEQVKA